MSMAHAEAVASDTRRQIDGHTIVREVTVTPAMCGHNALLVGQIGDWTWDTVSRLCGINAFRAADGEGHPTYLSHYFYQVLGGRELHLRSLTFGDRIQVLSTCYGFGSESVLTIHRLASVAHDLPAELSIGELLHARRPKCLYVQNVNRWIQRGESGNQQLHTASPLGFQKAHLPTLSAEESPRLVYDLARRQGAFVAPPGSRSAGEWTVRYTVDAARDLNGVGLLCFASYFAIVDGALAHVWRELGRTERSFMDRLVVDTRLCFLGNAEAGTRLAIRVRRAMHGHAERFDMQLVEEASQRMLAVAALDLEEGTT
ncbi:MAG: bifunctional acetyltransferase/decarboxylase lnmk2 from the leinamycin biosynthetic pathway [Myxococcaceae bacterium]|nr:bifunctional acetyltransferase/decarboxylase lnmk2 from the leinamycin biosynthetic pathway [Myxococcaceae bacterium]